MERKPLNMLGSERRNEILLVPIISNPKYLSRDEVQLLLRRGWNNLFRII